MNRVKQRIVQSIQLLYQAIFSTWFLACALGALGVALHVCVLNWSERNEFARLDDLATRQLDFYATALENEIQRYAYLPSLLEIDPAISALLIHPKTATSTLKRQANRRLASFAARTGAQEIFIITSVGTVIAASTPDLLIAPRQLHLPTISCAATQTGRQQGFLFHPKTAAPEYYFVHGIGVSIAEPAQPAACIVMKISLAPMEATWIDFSFRPDSEKVLVLDEHEVTILSSVPYWKYKTTPLFMTETSLYQDFVQAAKKKARIYPAPVTPLEIAWRRAVGRGASLVDMATQPNQPPNTYVAHSRVSISTGWLMVLLSSPAEVQNNLRTVQFASIAVLAFIGLLLLYLYHRRQTLRQLLLAQNELHRTHDELELTVARRTQELQQANQNLLHEMQERQQAEEALLHANKIAMLGQVSAKISHEISQPLTALRALAKNSRTFLSQQHWSRVDENLKTMTDIVMRMSNITRQLKIFSGRTRKKSTEYRTVHLNQVLQNARMLLQERLENEQARLVLPTQSIDVRGDSTQLEQVFVNLFTNALDALRDNPHKQIEVRLLPPLTTAPTRVQLCVQDNGPGISAEMHAHLFEPFYTSKQAGDGLGLGLVICASIIREHGSQLRVESTAHGAQFFFDLEWVVEQNIDPSNEIHRQGPSDV